MNEISTSSHNVGSRPQLLSLWPAEVPRSGHKGHENDLYWSIAQRQPPRTTSWPCVTGAVAGDRCISARSTESVPAEQPRPVASARVQQSSRAATSRQSTQCSSHHKCAFRRLVSSRAVCNPYNVYCCSFVFKSFV